MRACVGKASLVIISQLPVIKGHPQAYRLRNKEFLSHTHTRTSEEKVQEHFEHGREELEATDWDCGQQSDDGL